MNVWRRIILSIKRHPFQTLIQFSIIFILGNVLFASIAINQASLQVKEEMKKRMQTKISIYDSTLSESTIESKKNINLLIDELEENEKVNGIDIQSFLTVKLLYEREEIEPNAIGFLQEYYRGVSHFVGVNSQKESLFEYEIKEGRLLSEDEIKKSEAKLVLVVNQYDPEYKPFHVGEKLQIPIYDYEVKTYEKDFGKLVGYKTEVIPNIKNNLFYEFEIVGIVEGKAKYNLSDLNNIGFERFEVSQKCIDEMKLIQNELFEKHSESDKEWLSNSSFDFLYGLENQPLGIHLSVEGMENMEEMEQFILSNSNYPAGYYSIHTSADDYHYIQAPLENLSALTNVALVSTLVLIVILLSLVSILFLRSRVKEIGILRALGEKKRNIFLQFTMEMLFVGMLACGLSMMSGNVLGNVVSHKFMEIQIDVDSEQKYRLENPNELTQLDMLESYSVKLDGKYIILIVVSSAGVLILSNVLPLIYVMKVKANKVLM